MSMKWLYFLDKYRYGKIFSQLKERKKRHMYPIDKEGIIGDGIAKMG